VLLDEILKVISRAKVERELEARKKMRWQWYHKKK
jgi:hypothetical protein